MSSLPPDRSHVPTEIAHPSGRDLGGASIRESIEWIAEDHRRVVDALHSAGSDLELLIEAVVGALKAGGRLIYVGAGTSGRLGVLDASECPPTFNAEPSQVIGLIAGGEPALRRSSEGREDEFDGAHEQLQSLNVGETDVLIGIAAGGTTPYVLGAIEEAARRGAIAGMISCAPRAVPPGCSHLVVLETGPELLTGSTRLKAGSVTKLALNTITTIAFAQLGKVRGGLMIDLRASNQKLHDRAIRILTTLFPELSRSQAAAQLAQHDGRLRAAVESLARPGG
ncbi:MAG: N-acetylmuramic acid 6-phosphate etherase [Planctomycetota bacterium]|nr:N-acetylmuramic acid 6-phosphate etherase [Planctomycetota bacterium]